MGLSTEGRLAVIGAGKPPAEAAALLASARFTEMIAALRNLFDEIYLDVPPTLATADAEIVAHKSDGVVLVVRADSTPREQVDAAVRTLATTPVWGVVLNGVDPARVPAPLPVVRGRLAGR
jgi:Mrp family chromosome partitioning ATPase